MSEIARPASAIDWHHVLTEPMRIEQFAEYFDVDRHRMSRMLHAEIPGAIQLGGFWRVPLLQMPCGFLLARGFIRKAEVPVEAVGSSWHRLSKPL
jgi:hypothetical protein